MTPAENRTDRPAATGSGRGTPIGIRPGPRGPFGPTGPDTPGPFDLDVPDGILEQLPFAALDHDLPLLLLPVRLETRYRLGLDPPELRIRILPDQVSINADTPAPGRVERELAIEFWHARLAAQDDAGRQAAWRTFARRVGTRRAGWLARELRPVLRGPLGVPQFPAPVEAGERAPARPMLLPGQWLAVGYASEGIIFSVPSRPVAEGLRTAPDPNAPPWQAPESGLVTDEALAWMFDYERAVEVGMAITVPLTGAAAQAADVLPVLLVVGVDAELEPQDAAARLDALLAAHARTDGLAFVPQGTPTNNTETVTAGWSAQERALADLAARELDPVAEVPGDNAGRLANALGLADPTTLRRAAFGTDPEREHSRAMLRVTFEAVLGTFARQLLRVGTADGLPPTAADTLREWCTHWVTGGASLPTLAIGPQPYGVLPVCRSTIADEPATTAGHVQAMVSLLLGQWRAASGTVPVLDPNLIDSMGEGEHETAVATILATRPHPARLFLRWMDRYSSLNEIDDKFTPQGLFELFLLSLDAELNPAFDSPLTEIAALYWGGTLHDQVESIDEQIAAWQGVHDGLPALLLQTGHADLTGQAQDLIQVVLTLLEGWRRRQNPVASLGLPVYEGVLGEQNTELIEGVLASTSSEWGADGVVQARDAGPGHTAAEYLADLRGRFADRTPDLRPSGMGDDFMDRRPLLYQLLANSLHLVPDNAAENTRVLAALDVLAARTPEQLDRLLRESLGLGTHRLDAWATSIAAERLGTLRAARPGGIQIGAFGWVAGLTPRGKAGSAGFVHAPSMAHAATAAVLRSGWLAHGDDEPLAPAAVDIRSHRVRAAAWLLDGIRQGRDLGDLLGYRFERALHELGADHHVRPVRRKVLAAAGEPGVPPDEPVDGISLLDLDRANGLGTVERAVRSALDEIEAAFDAVNDVGLFEAVHQLTGAGFARATAMLDALATGTSAPPELRAPDIPRASIGVEHRVLVLLDPTAPHPGRGWKAIGERETIAPALGAWAASLLPDAGTVGFAARPPASDGGGSPSPPNRLTLKALGLSALDALWLVGEDPELVPAPLATLAAGAAGSAGPVTVDPAARGDATVSLAEFTVLAVELRRAVEALRVADARDLRPAQAAGEAETDDRAVLDAAARLVSSFDRLADDLSDALQIATPAAVTPVAERMARFGLATGRPPGDVAAAAALQPLLEQRLKRVGSVRVDPADPRPGLQGRVTAILGGRVPLLGVFELDHGAIDLTTAVADPVDVDDWLDAAGRVRADVGRLVTAGMLSELLEPGAGLRATAGQSPAAPGEGWAATSLPAPGTGGRLSVVAVTGPGGPPAPGARACGLVVDRWSERIPRTEQVTGVTFQFDAPGNRPPQTWLLAVPPDGEQWNLTLVLDTLMETLEWATLRAVGPENLVDYGRAVPTVFVPGSIANWPKEED
ncbi:hypothetical protein EDD29_5184 [Actinocorallia herbida]|uniref:Uncharacterized protein n=1 Tax=Actinocorallia herbida TaxID=58109 RepID=A0A3N1D230_9ACTN|nr:hypothetical protein [Actinocorallia herbida]ROO87571.1 hypothetical protein EDD29_5184 [Actinocorallia herbida]